MAWATREADNHSSPDESDPRVEVWRDGGGVVAAYARTSPGRSWIRLPGVGSFAFDPMQEVVTASPDEGVSKVVVAEAYRRSVLPLVQQARGHQVLHASAVRAPSGVVAFCGTSGTGKSTVAFAFSRRGYPVWGDDAVCFQTSDRGVDCIPLPFDLMLRPATASFFGVGFAAGPIGRPGGESETSALVPLTAVCILQRRTDSAGRAPAEVVPLSPANAFTATLEHAYAVGLRDRLQRKQLVERYLELAAATAVFGVSFERDLDQLDATVDVIEKRLALQPPPA